MNRTALLVSALCAGAALAQVGGCSSFAEDDVAIDAGGESGTGAEGGVEAGTDADAGSDGGRSLAPVFVRAVGGNDGGVVVPGGLVVDVSGSMFLSGSYAGSGVDLDGGSLPAPQDLDLFVLRLDGSGGYLGSKTLPTPHDQSAPALAGVGGALFVAIATEVPMVLSPTENLPSGADLGHFNSAAVLFSGDTLSPSGYTSFTGKTDDVVKRMAAAAGGAVISFGEWSSSISFNGGSSNTRGTGTGLFMARSVLPNGATTFQSNFCSTNAQCVAGALATDVAKEATFAGGAFQGTIGSMAADGGGAIAQNNTSVLDAFVMKVDSSLDVQWIRSFSGNGVQEVRAIGLVPGSDDIVVAGGFEGTLVLPDGLMRASRGLEDIFVIRLDATGGVVWSKTFGGPGADRVRAIAVDTEGGVILTGQFGSPTLDFGGGALTNADLTGRGTNDVFVAWLDSNGKHVSSVSFGDDADEDAVGLGLDGKGNVVFAGSFGGALTFGSTTVHARGKTDAFVAKLAR